MARLAILVGQPSEPGPYVIRVKVPGGVKLMPHTHPEDRIYTVISGVLYIGLGAEFDPDKLEAYPPGLGLDPDRNVIRDYLRDGTDTRAQKPA